MLDILCRDSHKCTLENAVMFYVQCVCYNHAVELSANDACVEDVCMSCCGKHRRLETCDGTTCSLLDGVLAR